MEGVEASESGGPPGLRLLLQLDPARSPGLDRTLLGFSLSALLSRLLGWSSKDGHRRGGSVAIAGEEEGSGNAAVSASALAAAVSLSLAAVLASSDQRPRRAPPPPLPRRRLRLPAPDSAARPRALLGPDDGLRILSSNDKSLENVIHGASIGAGDDEPDIIARVEMDATPAEIAGENAADETEQDEPEEEEERHQEELKRQQEHERLRELWLSLLEREQRLELRLQELESLRAQQATVRELESRVAAAAMEERLLQLKVSTLQEENGRLRAQVEELDTARAELARAKEKLRAIKARVEAEQDEAAALRAKVERGREEMAGAMAAEIAELRKANAALEEENLELALRLQDAEQAASASVNLVLEEDMTEEARYLRESNERLTRQIEQLHSDHCSHVEELVYLKWVNACLRHELRNDHDGHPSTDQQDHHQHADNAGTGDLSSALELSKSMSFRSSERAKQLMLKYGHPGLQGFDPALFSPLHESSFDSDGHERSPARSYYEPERSPYAASAKSPVAASAAAAGDAAAATGKKAGTRKIKFLGNIKKLLPGGGKKGHSSRHRHDDSRKKAPAASDEYLEKAMRWLSSTHDVLDGEHSYESTPLSSCARTPVSSVTTATTADDSRAARGGHSERGGETTTRVRPGAEPVMARSKSDAGRSYGREAASPYHALRPDHPARGGVETDGFAKPEKREPRRRSEDLRSPAVA